MYDLAKGVYHCRVAKHLPGFVSLRAGPDFAAAHADKLPKRG
jgi:hypothetical protein